MKEQCQMCLSFNEISDDPVWMVWECWNCQQKFWRDSQTHSDYLVLHGIDYREADKRRATYHDTIFYTQGYSS